MADIALVTANRVKVVESLRQRTLPAAEAIVAGGAVRIDTSGKFTPANGTTATEAAIWGIATKTVAAGEGLTAIRNGSMDGWDLSALAYSAPVYLSDTDGRIGTTAGTVSTVIGRVVPGPATTVGTAYDKILEVDL
jgi:hypothetical protein